MLITAAAAAAATSTGTTNFITLTHLELIETFAKTSNDEWTYVPNSAAIQYVCRLLAASKRSCVFFTVLELEDVFYQQQLH